MSLEFNYILAMLSHSFNNLSFPCLTLLVQQEEVWQVVHKEQIYRISIAQVVLFKDNCIFFFVIKDRAFQQNPAKLPPYCPAMFFLLI